MILYVLSFDRQSFLVPLRSLHVIFCHGSNVRLLLHIRLHVIWLLLGLGGFFPHLGNHLFDFIRNWFSFPRSSTFLAFSLSVIPLVFTVHPIRIGVVVRWAQWPIAKFHINGVPNFGFVGTQTSLLCILWTFNCASFPFRGRVPRQNQWLRDLNWSEHCVQNLGCCS